MSGSLVSWLPGPKNQNPTKPTKTTRPKAKNRWHANQQTNQVIENTPQTAKINMPFAESRTAAGAGLAGGLPKCGPIPSHGRLRVSRC
jgi:hypothetical protein